MSTRSALPATFFGSRFARVARAVANLKTLWDRRRLVGQLGALDDHMLRDIGITRQDIASVLAEPLYRDPSERLAERVAAGRHARRAAVLEAQAFLRGSETAADSHQHAA